MLNQKQFEILTYYAEKNNQAGLNKNNSLIHENEITKLIEIGYIKDGSITNKGLSALEPYRVKRAVFFAEGFDKKMSPITNNTPKALIRVNGKRLIDRMIDACLDVGISEIYIVRGYLSEQFDQLLDKYPTIRFLENPLYRESNNISSAFIARFFMNSSYIIEPDIFLTNNNIIKKYNYSSTVFGIKKERIEDWCFQVKDGIVNSMLFGGCNCYQKIGISYLSEEDGKKYAYIVQLSYDDEDGKQKFWDQVMYENIPKFSNNRIMDCDKEDVIKINNYRELTLIDRNYTVQIND